MLKLKKILPKEKIDPVDLRNRAAILDAKLLYTSMDPKEVDETEGELSRIRTFLDGAPA